MNIYRFNFIARCPTNGKLISYTYELRKPDTEKVLIEHIKTATALLDSGFHEDIADILFNRFGGVQILKANHHEVDIETRRGFDAQKRASKPAAYEISAEQIADVYGGEYPR